MPTGIYKHKLCSEETRKKMSFAHMGHIKYGNAVSRKGYKFSDESKLKMSIAHRGQRPWAKGKHWKIKDTSKMRGKVGIKNHMWRGGVTPINNKIRSSIENQLWIQSVFARDGYICQKTGIKGGKLTAHHIQNFAQFPELRFAIDNGITLSEESHKEFHKIYGRRNNTKVQLDDFLAKLDMLIKK
jgi:hypothetical protein